MSRFRWKIAALWDRLLLRLGFRERVELKPSVPVETVNLNDLYVWECRQYRACPSAFWFDHNRYHGQSGQWPDPSEDALRRAWDEATDEARALYGNAAVNELFARMRAAPVSVMPDPSNPFPYLMQHYKVQPSKGRYQRPG